jgi:hypothetical protein
VRDNVETSLSSIRVICLSHFFCISNFWSVITLNTNKFFATTCTCTCTCTNSSTSTCYVLPCRSPKQCYIVGRPAAKYFVAMSPYLQTGHLSDSDEQSALILPIREYGSIPQQSHKDPDETGVKHGTSLWLL